MGMKMCDFRSHLAELGASMDSEATRAMMRGIFWPAATRAAMERELIERRAYLRIGIEDVRG